MRNPIKTKIRRLESVGIMINEFEKHLKFATSFSKDAEGYLYTFGFTEHSGRFADLLGRLKSMQKDAAVIVDAALAELRHRREELRKELEA